MEMLIAIVGALATGLPMYAAWVTGIVIALARWEKHPRSSMFIVIGLGGMLLLSVVHTAVAVSLPLHFARQGMSSVMIGKYFAVIGIISSILDAGCWTLILMALFGERNQGRR
jgi:hypothetical protein